LITSIFQNSKKFFDLSVEEKKEILMEKSEHAFRGYY
jgi:isopenicillin N synthase-like dioxygenase